jgi:hypothetical protein
METYSQRNQDRFVVDVLKSKTNGTFLDFGCRCPFEGNNTYLFEKNYGFSGLSFDIDSYEISKWYQTDRNYNNVICCDLMNYNFEKKLEEFYSSNVIDYFSFDLEPPLLTLEVLKKFPFDKYKFGVVTFEHDFYRGFDTLKPSREIFIKNGYKKVKKEYMQKFETETAIWFSEDWWIHPDVVSLPDSVIEHDIIHFVEDDMKPYGIPSFWNR